MKKCLLIVIFLLACFGLARLYYAVTDDFRLSNISHAVPAGFVADQPDSSLREILNQPYSYIGKGAQSYAFSSEDGQYVLKFFKFKHLKPSWWIDLLPSLPLIKSYKESVIQRKERKLTSLFQGYELAYREDRDNAQLIYVHLAPTDFLNMQVTITDKIGLTHQVELDPLVFLVQRKGEMFKARLDRQLKEGQLAEAEASIRAIFDMYISEYQKGLYDRDHGVMQNTGFVGDRPFHLDVGKLSRDDSVRTLAGYRGDLELVAWKINYWIQENHPDQSPALLSFIAEEYRQRTEAEFKPEKITKADFKQRRGTLERLRQSM